MSTEALSWATPASDSLASGYAAFLRETGRRLENACLRLEDDCLDQHPAPGLMSVRDLLLHCNKLLAVSSLKAVGVDCSGDDESIVQSEHAQEITDILINSLVSFIEQVETKGLVLPLEQYALKPINDLGHHAGQIAIFPRLFQDD